jgi:hypothetical protein
LGNPFRGRSFSASGSIVGLGANGIKLGFEPPRWAASSRSTDPEDLLADVYIPLRHVPGQPVSVTSSLLACCFCLLVFELRFRQFGFEILDALLIQRMGAQEGQPLVAAMLSVVFGKALPKRDCR